MKTHIKETKGTVCVEFDSDKYCLLKKRKDGEETTSLNYLIDMSYKGKDPQVGMPVMVDLSDEDVALFMKAGFVEYS